MKKINFVPHLMANLLLILPLFSGFSALADETSRPGFLPEFNYQVTELSSMQEAQAVMDLETRDTNAASICANRAELWSFDMYRKHNVQTGKVFIHFTPKGEADENGKWAYHVAPYIILDGEEYVLDAGFGEFHGKPTPMTHWMKYFGKSDQCVVLDPVHNPADLKLEQNDMPNDWTLPIHFSRGGARQYPTPANANCYVRKVPMYYYFPVDVYGVDLYLAGNHDDHQKFLQSNINPYDVLQACKQATSIKFKLDHRCKDYLDL